MFNYGMSGNQFMYGQQSQQPQGAGNNIVWVQGMAGAKAYPVAPGAAVWMMDSEEKQFYVKSVDGSGIPNPLRVFRYEEMRERRMVDHYPVPVRVCWLGRQRLGRQRKFRRC